MCHRGSVHKFISHRLAINRLCFPSYSRASHLYFAVITILASISLLPVGTSKACWKAISAHDLLLLRGTPHCRGPARRDTRCRMDATHKEYLTQQTIKQISVARLVARAHAPCHAPHATCHMSFAMCHAPSVTCHMPFATCHVPLFWPIVWVKALLLNSRGTA